MSDDLTPSGESAVRLALEVGRLRRERDDLRAAVARVRSALDATHRHGEWQTRQAVLAALEPEVTE